MALLTHLVHSSDKLDKKLSEQYGDHPCTKTTTNPDSARKLLSHKAQPTKPQRARRGRSEDMKNEPGVYSEEFCRQWKNEKKLYMKAADLNVSELLRWI